MLEIHKNKLYIRVSALSIWIYTRINSIFGSHLCLLYWIYTRINYTIMIKSIRINYIVMLEIHKNKLYIRVSALSIWIYTRINSIFGSHLCLLHWIYTRINYIFGSHLCLLYWIYTRINYTIMIKSIRINYIVIFGNTQE